MLGWIFGSTEAQANGLSDRVPEYEIKVLKAIETGDLTTLSNLISQYKIEPNQRCHVRYTQGPFTYLIFAAQNNQSSVIRYLHSLSWDVNLATKVKDRQNGETPLLRAAYLNRIDALTTLLEVGATVNVGDYQKNPLYMTILRNKHVEPIEILLKNGADIDNVLRAMTLDLYQKMVIPIRNCLNRYLAWRERRKIFLLKYKSHSTYNRIPGGIMKEICEYI
jgi:hypothetical protein